MTAAANLTYNSLIDDLPKYCERVNDDAFVDQCPRLLLLAENRIAAEARGLGLIETVTGNLGTGSSGSAFAKPARWREGVSLTIGIGSSYEQRKVIRLRGYEYCRMYWPDPTETDEPVYYANWNWEHYLIAPSPDVAYPYEHIYFERPVPLSSDVQTNWTTQYAPQLLTYACLLEASTFVKNKDLVDQWQSQYDRALKQVEFEAKRQLMDRGIAYPNPQ